MALTNSDSLRFFAPELLLTAGAVVVFLADLLLSKAKRRPLILTSLAVLFAVGAVLLTIHASANAPQSLFGGLLAFDGWAVAFKLLCFTATAFALLMATPGPELPKERTGDYAAILLALSVGMSLMASANDLLMVSLGVELVSLLSYGLAGFKKGARRSAEAALKYVVYGGVASGVMLFGMSYLYGLSGTTSLGGIHAALTGDLGRAGSLALLTALVLVLAGVGFKVAAVPWHMWAPDVYEGAPTPFTAFLSVGPKAAGFALAIRLFSALFGGSNLPWAEVLGVIAAATMTVGNLAALNQTSVKRMLAWSSVAHAGYLLLGVCAGTAAGHSAVLFYLVVYLFMNLGAFLVVDAVARRGGGERLADYKGLSSRAPAVALSFAIFLFSLTGLPPLAGFVGKFQLFKALIDRGGGFFVGLAVIAVLNSAVSLYYYARIARAMYLDSSTDGERITLPATYPFLLGIFAGAVVVLGVAFDGLRGATDAAARALGAY
ncbi:MAG: NADH-quinone oxidoreductase subunit N [Myxococcaceae bacterium]